MMLTDTAAYDESTTFLGVKNDIVKITLVFKQVNTKIMMILAEEP